MSAPPVVGNGERDGGIRNMPNMVAEQVARGPGGMAVPIPQGGTPEAERGRRSREDSRSRSSTTRRWTQTPLQREPSIRLNPLLFGGHGAQQQ